MEEKLKTKESKIHFLDYMIIFLKRKRLIMYMTFGPAALCAVIVLLLSDIFMSEARVMPPQQPSAATSQMLSQLTGGLSLGGLLGGGSSDLYAGMLESRTVLDAIISKYDLKKLYKEDSMIDTRDELLDNIKIEVDPKSMIISVFVYDKDAKRAANMANTFVDELKKLSAGLAITDAAQRRLYYEEQLKATKLALTKAEDDLKVYAEKTGVMQPDDQAQAIITNDANVRAQIATKEVEIKVLKTYATANNPDLQRAEEALRGLKTELGKLEMKGGTGPNPLMPTGSMPSLTLEYLRKMRDVKFNEKLLETIKGLYEMAKMDEAKLTSVIQVVDYAVPSDKKEKPKRALLVLIAAAAGFFLSLLVVLIVETKERVVKNDENTDKINALKSYSDFGVRKAFRAIFKRGK